MNISELEKASGTPRSTIYFYVRDGLLPVAKKKAASRAVYSEEHAHLLQEITRLKEDGLPLHAIRERVAPLVKAMTAANADSVDEHAETVRQAILRAAARQFSRKGYRATRIGDIIEEAGITAPVFYSHFPSKQDLFVEAFGVFVDWMRRSLESRMAGFEEPVARELSRVQSYYFGIKLVSANLLSMVRSEALKEDSDLRETARDTFKHMIHDTRVDLAALRRENGEQMPMVDELVAFGLFGAMDAMVMRACWDDTYSADDVLRTACGIFLGIQALYSGRLDISEEMAGYEELIRKLAAGRPQLPQEDLL